MPPADHIDCITRYVDAITSLTDHAGGGTATHYEKLVAAVRAAVRAADQRHDTALARIGDAVAPGRPVRRRQLRKLVAAAQQDRDADYVVVRGLVRTLGHHGAATCRAIATHLAELVDPLDTLADALRRGPADAAGDGGGEPGPDGYAP
jgi:hypothetical protein